MKYGSGILFFLFIHFLTLYGQHGQVESLTIEHGLSQGMVYSISQTSDGFLWFATKDGLNRYDGYNFKIFNHDPFFPYSLAENTVTALFEDSRGWLWVGTDSKGVDLYDRKTGLFHHFPPNFDRSLKGDSFEVVQIFEASDGSIYLIQNGYGLVRIQLPAFRTGQLPEEADLGALAEMTLFPLEKFLENQEEERENSLVAIEEYRKGEIRVYTRFRAFHVDPEGGKVSPVKPLPGGKRPGKGRYMWGAVPYNLVYFKEGREATPVFPPSSGVRKSMVSDAGNGYFWLAANNRLWLAGPGEIPDFSKPHWQMDADIASVIADRNGHIWVGTEGYGLRKIIPQKEVFHKGAEGRSIWGMWRDHRGRYYVKVKSNIFPYDPESGQVGDTPAFPAGPDRVLDIHMDPSGWYWLLGRGDQEGLTAELRRFNPETWESESFPFPVYTIDGGRQEQLFKPFLYSRLIKTRDGRLWATGRNCLLVRFDPKTGEFDHFDYSQLFHHNAAAVRALSLVEGPDSVLWIGTQMGLVKCKPRGESYEFELIQASGSNPRGLNNSSIACLLPDSSGILWIGTKGGGINRLDLRTGVVRHITTKDGLPDNVVYAILPGAPGELWCSTNRGLAKLKVSQTGGLAGITAFTAAQGLQDNEFNTQAFFRASNGELLFGGVNGLNRFFPKDVLTDTTPPPVFLVGLRINHLPVDFRDSLSPLSGPIELAKEIQLRHHQNNISFEFSALDFTDPSKNRYRYKLLGVDEDWVETGTYRFAHFTHLKPGSYTFLVQGNNGEGGWQSIPRPVSIVIATPWWSSGAAYLVYILLITYGLWQAYQFQMRRIQMREQLAYEHRESARLKAMEQMKTDFFNNITHEFRTPLTLMLEPARRILNQTKDAEIQSNARHIETNSLRLLDMVNQLLDLAKLENGNMGLDLRTGDFSAAVREVVDAFFPMAGQQGVSLSLSAPEDLSEVTFDLKKTEHILNNLLSNAFKFTPKGGEIRVEVEQTPMGIQLFVRDTGIGIPPDALGKIFDRFYQVEGGEGGAGIGLALSREFAERMGGTLSVQSEQGKGAVFTFQLPLSSPAKTPAPVDAERPIALLIEDNPELRGFVAQCISGPWQVVEATNGEEGLRQAREIIPDLIISDLMMPLKDGYAVVDEIRSNELTAHIPVILLTAKSAMDAKIKGLRAGADDYLTKPFNTDELLARMENLVSMRRRLLQPGPASDEHLTDPDREFLKRFTALLDENLSDENMSVEILAQRMFLSRVQLHRKLKAITDRSVSEFVRDYRLDRAMAMLKKREGLVYEVASRVGFGNEKYFSRAFKEKFGLPPSQVN